MNIRRMILQMIGGKLSVWKQKQISPSSDISLSADVYTWLETEIAKLNLSTNSFVCILRDNIDLTKWDTDEFVGTMFNKDQPSNVNKVYLRCRGISNIQSVYLQNRNFISNETCKVYASETYTIFYQ